MAANAGDVVKYAETFLGRPYIFGAAGPSAFDCSGLVQYVYHHFGVDLPHYSQSQAKYGTSVAKTAIQPGDLVFSDWGDGPDSHVGIAVSPNKIIDAPHTGANVRYDDLTSGYLSHVTNVRRMSGVTGGAAATLTDITKGGAGDFGQPGPGDLLGQLAGAPSWIIPFAQPLQDIASAAAEGSRFASLLMKAFLPTNAIRIWCGVIGTIFILMGLLFLTREVRSS